MSEDLEKLVVQVADSIGNPRIPELVEKLARDKGLKYRDAARTVCVLWKRRAWGFLSLSPLKPS